MRADGAGDTFPIAQLARERFHLPRTGCDRVELLGRRAVGRLDRAIEFGRDGVGAGTGAVRAAGRPARTRRRTHRRRRPAPRGWETARGAARCRGTERPSRRWRGRGPEAYPSARSHPGRCSLTEKAGANLIRGLATIAPVAPKRQCETQCPPVSSAGERISALQAG